MKISFVYVGVLAGISGGPMLVPRRIHGCEASVEKVCEPIHLCASKCQAGLTGE